MDKPEIKKNDRCRICFGKDLVEFLDLGFMPLANVFLTKDECNYPESKYPLNVYVCNGCGLVQLLDVVNPEILFRQYRYLTSSSKPLVSHFERFGDEIVQKYLTSFSDLVVEIGSNDGSLIKNIKNKCRVLGIDPAENVVEIAKERDVPILVQFFSSSIAKKIVNKWGQAQVIVANNVVAHIDDLEDFFYGIKTLLHSDGCFIFEVHWVGDLIGEGGFDQIYHEHLSYFSLHAIQRIADIHGFNVFDVQLVPIHGQSLRVYFKKEGRSLKTVDEFLKKERKIGLLEITTFKNFTEKAENTKKNLTELLYSLKKQNYTIVGYGAPAKGNILLNYCNLDSTIIEYLIDTTPLKQGLYTPGTHIPVLHPNVIRENPPNYLLLLAWNYSESIISKEKWFKDRDGKFIIPVPGVQIC
jgi:SAM-dependent methyltransferase